MNRMREDEVIKVNHGRLVIWLLMILLVCGALLILIMHLPNRLMQNEVDETVLTIHSPLNERIIIPIIKEFQENTGIKVDYTYAGTLDILESLDAKGDRHLMDIMWGGSKEYLSIYEDLFEPISTLDDMGIQERGDMNEDHMFGYNLLPIVLVYNKKLVSSEEVCTSWKELLDPKWKGRLAFADPGTSGSAFIALSFLLELDRETPYYNWENARKLIENLDGKMLPKSSDVYEGVAKGDFAIGISMEEAAIEYIHKGEDIGIIYLQEGTPVITDSIAILKDARNKEDAELFVEFVLSKKVQSYMVDRFYLRSIRQDVDVPLGLHPMEEINQFDASVLTTYDNKAEVLHTWRQMTEEAGRGDK